MNRNLLTIIPACLLIFVGCSDPTLLLNPSFVNRTQGGLFPLVPRPESGLLFVRVVNNSADRLTFVVTVERSTQVDDTGEGTFTEAETVELFTEPVALANEAGILFECTVADDPISRVGLGRNLNQPTTDPGLFIGGFGDQALGFGAPANINPLNLAANDFQCGDTVIFEAFRSPSEPGGFRVNAFVLPWERQPENTLRQTFQVAADFIRGRPREQ